LAVADELKRLRPDVQIIYIGQKGDRLADIPAEHPSIDRTYSVRAGKFRRFHGEGWKQFLNLSVQFKNLIDALRVISGTWQSFWLMRKLRPQIIFTRGGFVSVPVAIGGHLNGVPYITHDSDSIPSLANRIIAKKAVLHAVAMPPETYPYNQNRTVTVGIPLSGEYQLVTPALQQAYRRELKLDAYKKVLFITGGGNGADKLNNLIIKDVPALLARYTDLAVIHITGRDKMSAVTEQYDRLVTEPDERRRIWVEGFVGDVYRYNGAADIVVSRGGATTLAELAVQGKACVIIPAKQLIWNVKNVHLLAEKQAIVALDEDCPSDQKSFATIVSELLDNDQERLALSQRFQSFAHPHAAQKVAELLLQLADKSPKQPTHEVS